MNKAKKIPYNFRWPEDLLNEVKKMASSKGVTLTEYIRALLEKEVIKKSK